MKQVTSMTWVLPQPIKCYYRSHGPIKYLEKHDIMNCHFLSYSSVMAFAVIFVCHLLLSDRGMTKSSKKHIKLSAPYQALD